MAELATIARPYAEAAFALARDEQALPAWSEMLQLRRVDRRATTRVAEALDNPRLDSGGEGIAAAVDRRRPVRRAGAQFHPRAGRGRARRAAAADRSDVRDAEERCGGDGQGDDRERVRN